MRKCLCLVLVSVVLALTACTLAVPPKSPETPETSEAPKTPTLLATPERVYAVEKCVHITLIMVEAWLDRDGNGSRDAEDEPLQGVRFRWESVNLGPHYLTTDGAGHGTLKLSGCCGGQLVPETPANYRLTKAEAECKSEPKSGTCSSYGFAPTTP
jgi:hypothetical protein